MRSKKNKKKLIIAIFLGVIATFSLFSSMNSQKAVIAELNKKLNEQINQQNDSLAELKKNPKAAEEEKINAVIAAKDINVGDIFVLELLEVKKFEEDELPANYFKNEAMIVGKKAGRNVVKGGFITPTEIQATDINTINIPNDARAITIPVEKFKGLASHIKVGSRVDVLKVSNPPEFIAQNIKVVSFEAIESPTSGRDPKKAEVGYMTAKKASAITFLVPVDLVSSLIDAMFEGQLQIITRNNNDEKILVTETELPPPPAEVASVPEAPPIPPSEREKLPEPDMPRPDPQKIEFIKASNRTTLEIEPESIQISSEENDDLSDEKLRELLDMVN